MEKEYDFIIRLVLVGEAGAGKSTLIQQYSKGEFNPFYVSTIGVDFHTKILDVDDKKVKIQVWDTAGQERFRIITKSYYRRSAGIILMFDLADEESFDNLSYWMSDIDIYKEDYAKILLIGNKSDLEQKVSQSKIENFCDIYKLNYLETSALLNKNVEQVFIDISRSVINGNKIEEAIIPKNVLKVIEKKDLECCSVS
jgi:small GTP-binding protein